tara:strand:+ start:98 stop:451 length:354 start_codon:yes stop_codon:yes gene_type:complete
MKNTQNNERYFVIKEYDDKIKKELRNNKNDKNKCPSYWGKKLFLETEYFNNYNWNLIQTDYYLSKKDNYQRNINNLKDDFFKQQKALTDQYKFMYEAVLEHKKRLFDINGEMYYDIS